MARIYCIKCIKRKKMDSITWVDIALIWISYKVLEDLVSDIRIYAPRFVVYLHGRVINNTLSIYVYSTHIVTVLNTWILIICILCVRIVISKHFACVCARVLLGDNIKGPRKCRSRWWSAN